MSLLHVFLKFMFSAKLAGYEMNVTCLCTVLGLRRGNTDYCIQVLTKTMGELNIFMQLWFKNTISNFTCP